MDTAELFVDAEDEDAFRAEYYVRRPGYGNSNSFYLMQELEKLAKNIRKVGKYSDPRDYYYIDVYDAEYEVDGEVIEARIRYVYARMGISTLYVGVRNAKTYKKFRTISEWLQ